MNRRRVRSDGRMLFIALAIVLTALLVGIVLQRTAAQRIGVMETPTSDVADAAAALPEDIGNPAVAGIHAAVDPTYVYAYERGEGVHAAVVQWSRRDGDYVMAAELDAAKLGLVGAKDPRVVPHVTGWGGVAVSVHAMMPGADVVSLASFADDAFTPIRVIDEEGAFRPAVFSSGTDGDAYAEHRFEDVDGDGRMELIVTEGFILAQGDSGEERRTANIRVFTWNGTQLVYDEEASWAFSLSDEVFPDPEGASDEPPAF